MPIFYPQVTHSIGGNTAGTAATVGTGTYVLAGGNNITLSQNANTVTISAGAGGGAVVSNAIQQVSSATGSGTNTSRFAADDHVHAGVYHVGVSNDAGNTSGDTRVSFGRFVFRGGNNVTLSQITAANELNTIVVSAANAGAGAAQSFYMWPDEIQNTSSWAVSGSTSYVQPVYIPYDISISYLRLKGTFSCVGSMAAVGTAANASRGMTMSSTINAGFYTQGVGASSRSLVTYATGSASWVQQARLHAAAVGSNWTSGHTISYPFEGGNTDFTTSAGATSASLTMQSSQLTNFTGMRFLDIPFNTSLAQGAYWFLYGSSTSLSTSGTANISTVRILASNVVATQINAAWNKLGVATNSSNHFRQGLGSWSTNTIGTIVGTIALANISTSGSNPIILMQMIRQA